MTTPADSSFSSSPLAYSSLTILAGASPLVSLPNGNTTEGAIVNSGESMIVSSGETAVSTTVNSGGSLSVRSGGTASEIKENGGYVYVYADAYATFAANTFENMVISSSIATVHSGTTANSTTVNDGGRLYVYSGGTANSATINRGGLMAVYSGGTADGTIANSWLQVSSCGKANNTIVSYGGSLQVYSGGIAAESIVNSYGFLHVENGGIVARTTVNSGGELRVSSGGTADVTIVNSCGHLNVFSGGMAHSTIVNSSGELIINSCGIADGTVINSIGYLEISSGGMANRTTINTRGRLRVSSGGTAGSTTINNGYLYVNSGGIASSTIVNSGGSLRVYSNGTAKLTTVNAGGSLEVYNGMANSTTVNSDGVGYVYLGGNADRTTVNSHGCLKIFSGGTANSTTVNSGAILYVSSGGTASAIKENGGYVYLGTDVHATFVENALEGMVINNSATIHSGTTANNTNIASGGILYVFSGGTASAPIVNFGGSLVVSSGGTVSAIRENGGCVYIDSDTSVSFVENTLEGMLLNDATATIHIGTTANNTTVNSGGLLDVSSGGRANSTTVNSRGYLYVSSGGRANSTTVNSRGYLYVSSGGTANSTTVNTGAYLSVFSGGTALAVKENGGYVYIGANANVTFVANAFDGAVLSNSATIHSGTTANSTTLNNGGLLYVYSGGTATSTTVNIQGRQYVYSGAMVSGTILNSQGMQWVGNGAIADSTTVNNGAHLDVYIGGTANNTTVNSGGWLIVYSCGTANGTTMNSGASLRVSSGGTANSTTVNSCASLRVSSGGTANSTTLNSGGSLLLSSGGTANSTTVNNGASIVVSSGVMANSTVVNSGGSLYVSSGGTANSTTLNSGGSLSVSSGGTAISTTVNPGGSLVVSNSGTASVIKENGGCVEVYLGAQVTFVENTLENLVISDRTTIHSGTTANNTTVNSGGRLYVYSGGTAFAIKENGGYVSIAAGAQVTFVENTFDGMVVNGAATIHSGTTANSTTVTTGGNLYVSSGGTANSTTVNSSGCLIVSSGGTVNSTTVNTAGYLYVYSGGTATAIKENGGYVGVGAGANVTFVSNTLEGVVINTYNSATLHSGTTANSTIVNTYGHLYIASGGTANSTFVDSGGLLYVSSGGTASAITARRGATLWLTVAPNTYIQGNYNGSAFEMKDACLAGYTVNDGGDLYISSGGTADSTTVNTGAYLAVHSGGTATAIKENGGYVSIGAGAQVTFVENTLEGLVTSRSVTIHSGTTANSTTITSGGNLFVSSGGITDGSIVNYKGSMLISRGGIANRTTVNNGGYLCVSTGGMANSTVVNSDGNLCVSSGGTANSTAVNSGGNQEIFSGGTANSTTVNPGGSLVVSYSGTASAIKENGGFVSIGIGAKVTFVANTFEGVEIDNSATIHSGTTANSITVTSGGYLYVSSGGTASAIKENGGCVIIDTGAQVTFAANTFEDVVINKRATIHSGTTANSTTVNAWGDLCVCSGGTANNTTVNTSGDLYVNSGGTATAIKENGGYVSVEAGANVTFVSNTLEGVVINDNKSATIHSGTTANSTTVRGVYAKLSIFNGGRANSTTVINQGRLYVSSGGTVNSTIVNSAGFLYVSSGGTALAIKENGGYVSIASGAQVTFVENTLEGVLLRNSATIHSRTTANSTTVNSGGRLFVCSGGTANSTTVNSWGHLLLSSGGTANSTVVNSDGNLCVSSGGTANSTTVNFWGHLYVFSGGTANRTTVNSWGYLLLSSGGTTNSTTVNSWGRLYVSSGGTASGITAYNGAYLVLTVAPDTYIQGTYDGSAFEMKDACLAGYTVNEGGDLYVSSGGTANNTTVNNAGYLYVFSGGTASAIKENGGYVGVGAGADVTFLENTLENLVVNAWTTIHSGTMANSTTVNSRGRLFVYSGGLADGVIVSSGGSVNVTSGGLLSNQLVIEDGALVTVADGASYRFDLASPGDTYFIQGYGNITGSLGFTASVSGEQARGDYRLIAGVEAFDSVISVVSDTGAAGQISIENKALILDNTGYVLELKQDEGLLLHVVAPIQLTADTETITQKAVLTAETETGLDIYFSTDNETWTQYTQALDITVNGTWYFKATDAAGNTGTESITFSNIDTTAPVIELTGDNVLQHQETVLSASTEEGVDIYYSTDNETWSKYTEELAIASNGTWYFKATDAAGNVGLAEMTFGNIVTGTSISSAGGSVQEALGSIEEGGNLLADAGTLDISSDDITKDFNLYGTSDGEAETTLKASDNLFLSGNTVSLGDVAMSFSETTQQLYAGSGVTDNDSHDITTSLTLSDVSLGGHQVFGGSLVTGASAAEIKGDTSLTIVGDDTVAGRVYAGHSVKEESNRQVTVNGDSTLEIQGGTFTNVRGGMVTTTTALGGLTVKGTTKTAMENATVSSGLVGDYQVGAGAVFARDGSVSTTVSQGTAITGALVGAGVSFGGQYTLGADTSPAKSSVTVQGGSVSGNIYGGACVGASAEATVVSMRCQIYGDISVTIDCTEHDITIGKDSNKVTSIFTGSYGVGQVSGKATLCLKGSSSRLHLLGQTVEFIGDSSLASVDHSYVLGGSHLVFDGFTCDAEHPLNVDNIGAFTSIEFRNGSQVHIENLIANKLDRVSEWDFEAADGLTLFDVDSYVKNSFAGDALNISFDDTLESCTLIDAEDLRWFTGLENATIKFNETAATWDANRNAWCAGGFGLSVDTENKDLILTRLA